MSKITKTIKRIKLRERERGVPGLGRGVHSGGYSGTTWDYLMRIAAMPEPRVKLRQGSSYSGGRSDE